VKKVVVMRNTWDRACWLDMQTMISRIFGQVADLSSPAADDEVRVHWCTKESPRSRKTWGLSAAVRGDTWGVGVTDADSENAGGRPLVPIETSLSAGTLESTERRNEGKAHAKPGERPQ
jgi:hypothetical protein